MDRKRLRRRRRARGVTLVELLVVMAILAFVAGLIALNAPPAQSQAKAEAEKFAARARAAWEEAVIDGAVFSIAVTPAGYEVDKLDNGEWKPADKGRYFSRRTAPRGVSLAAVLTDPAALNKKPETVDKPEDAPARIILDPIGVTTPFVVEFADRSNIWVVRNASDETIILERKGG